MKHTAKAEWMIEMQRCTIFSHGKVKLGKQALATDRRLSGVKKGHFSKILQERRKRSNIGEANERRAGVISWGKGRGRGRVKHNSKAIYYLFMHLTLSSHASPLTHWSSNRKKAKNWAVVVARLLLREDLLLMIELWQWVCGWVDNARWWWECEWFRNCNTCHWLMFLSQDLRYSPLAHL